MMRIVKFRLGGRLGHFARAETATSILTYPVPPRTTLMGVAAAILGLPKDVAPHELEPFHCAVAGVVPRSHWHRAKLRKDPPRLLPITISHTQSTGGPTAPEKASLIYLQWLWNPMYMVWMALPAAYHESFAARLRDRRWHFSPCLGLSEMMAEVEYQAELDAHTLPVGEYYIASVLRQDKGTLNSQDALERALSLELVTMPSAVTAGRVFSHAAYVIEHNGQPLKVFTSQAWQAQGEVIMLL